MAENEIPPKAADNIPPQTTPPKPGEQIQAGAAPETPPKPADAASPPAASTSPAKAAPAGPAYEEFGTAKRNLPPMIPVALAILLVAVVIGILAYTNRAKPTAQGSIDGVWFSQPANMTSPMILMEVTLHNVGEKSLYIRDIKAGVKTDEGEQTDDAAAATDYDRYLSAYPALSGHAKPLHVEMKVAPGADQKGSVMISVPITQQQFDARKDLTVTIERYDQAPLVIHEKAAAAK